jgi:hypothetical protein
MPDHSDQGIERAASALADLRATCTRMTPREQAEAAWTPTGPPVEVLEDRIRARRGMAPATRATKSA